MTICLIPRSIRHSPSDQLAHGTGFSYTGRSCLYWISQRLDDYQQASLAHVDRTRKYLHPKANMYGAPTGQPTHQSIQQPPDATLIYSHLTSPKSWRTRGPALCPRPAFEGCVKRQPPNKVVPRSDYRLYFLLVEPIRQGQIAFSGCTHGGDVLVELMRKSSL